MVRNGYVSNNVLRQIIRQGAKYYAKHVSRDGKTSKEDSQNRSPADNGTLEVSDEILEVNGRTLENATHTEVIQYIHEASTLEQYVCVFGEAETGTWVSRFSLTFYIYIL
ncbi:hypothetical protein ALC53_08543 [Atta colombica]|uniref:PDZ domain-containing protein n=1 Tax=Atta colombica TaxID=520822 RepID=A0A151I2A2_9HYME|nr:hypothetical protein ALC53_08543 [Atta colombica]